MNVERCNCYTLLRMVKMYTMVSNELHHGGSKFILRCLVLVDSSSVYFFKLLQKKVNQQFLLKKATRKHYYELSDISPHNFSWWLFSEMRCPIIHISMETLAG